MKPPFSYYGGKQRIVSKIIPYIPKHTVYAEPFCGGATLLFAKPDYKTGVSHYYREAINDINSDVYNFFVILRDRKDELIRLIEAMPYSQEEYRNAKNYQGEDPLLRAYYFFVNISQSFANGLNKGWGTSVFLKNHAKTYLNKVDNLKECADRLKQVHLANEDALRFIDRWDSPQTFFYCDPPYPSTSQGHYSGYTQEDFERLLEKLCQCKGSFILSCYPNDAVPKEWQKVEFHRVNTSSNLKNGGHREKRTECIWIREAREKCRPEIEKVYEKQQRKFDEQLVLF